MLLDVEDGVGLIDHDVADDFVLVMPPFWQKSTRERQGYTRIDMDQSNLLRIKMFISYPNF